MTLAAHCQLPEIEAPSQLPPPCIGNSIARVRGVKRGTGDTAGGNPSCVIPAGRTGSSIQDLLFDAMMLVEPDVREMTYSNIVLAGGNTRASQAA